MKKGISEKYLTQMTVATYWSLRGLLVLAILFFLFQKNLASAGSTMLILLLTLLPSLIKRRYQIYIPFTLDVGITIFVFLTLFLGEVARFYDRIPLWDKFLHFQSGLLLGVTGYVLIYILNEHKKFKLNLNPVFISLFAITFSITIGALWEIGEYTWDSFTGGTWAAGLSDTIWDLIADSIGALIVSVAGYFWMYRHKRLPFTPWFLHVFQQAKEKIDKF